MSHNLIRDLFYSVFHNPKKYLTSSKGNSPIILSAPHGGGIIPLGIPQRTYGNRGKDSYTRRLIQEIIYQSHISSKPYYIYSDIHRKIVDLNREIVEGAQGNLLAETIWRTWHFTLKNYLGTVRTLYVRGLYIDIHSHNNSDEFQIGYGLPVKDYSSIYYNKPTKKRSYMYPLKEIGSGEYSILFGIDSFPQTLLNAGYKVDFPTSDKEFLNGGYDVKIHHGKGIGALQIECPISVLKYDYKNVASTLAHGITEFQERFIR